MTLREVLAEGTALLQPVPGALLSAAAPYQSATIDTPALDAALLLGSVLQTSRARLILAADEPVSEAARQRYTELLKRRLQGECVAWILGYKEFWGLEFTVSPEVLVPRPDTETLVDAALAAIDALPPGEPGALLDLCTGSGAVAIALKHERPSMAVYASDISPAAVALAQANAARLLPGTMQRGIQCIESDLFDRIPGRFAIITANPPYLPSRMIDTLALEVRKEPRISLDGGADGLELIRRITSQAKTHLIPGGTLLMEADPRQMHAITGILEDHGYRNIRAVPDLSHRLRVISAAI
ncbi:MAG: peptide chain release factor N(5)-glutamine methyltransferase [Treponema sp.]|jgi:release factor glutamine methyltransferase|nr:peptide chain release factor N(5)-glutamine methyltransferase [Treponema sp.]